MERCKTLHKYVKLNNKEKHSINKTSSNVLKRSRLRSSLRRLKCQIKKNSSLITPLTLQQLTTNKDSIKYQQMPLASNNSHRQLSTNNRVINTNVSCDDINDHGQCTIEEIMLKLPVPHKACKLLNIPEAEYKEYSTDQQSPAMFYTKNVCNSKSTTNLLQSGGQFVRSAQLHKTYASTRLKTATIRKPMPYLNSNNVQQLKPSPRTSAPPQAECFLCSSNSNNNKFNNNSNNNNNNNTHSHATDNNYEIISLRKTHHTCNPSTASVPSHLSIEYTPPILQPQQNHPTNYHHHIPHQNTTPSACNNNYTIINRFNNNTDQHSNNRDNPTYYVESGVNSINCHISSPVQDNLHENAKIFNLSKQLKQENVITVAKLRNAISCHSQHAKDMEYLLPPQNQQKKQHSHNHNHNHKHNHYHYYHCQRYTRQQQLHQEQTQTQQKEQHQHSCHSIDSEKLFNDNKSKTNMLATTSSTSTTTATTQNNNNKILSSSTSSTRHTTKFNQFYQTAAKYELNGIGVGVAGSSAGAGMGDEENTDSSNISSLAIYRQPANVRHKGGNTPYRSKMSKKQLKLAQAQLDKLTQCNLHLHALFSAVEHGHLDKACTILESTDVNVNSINTDGLSALDIAVLSNNRSMTKMLLQHGALEGSQFSVDSLGTKLSSLLKEAESHIQDLNGFEATCQSTYTTRSSISSIIIGNTSSSVTGCTGNEIDKQIGVWERRIKGLRRLILGWDQARPPDAPASVIVDVMGDNTVQVQILEPFDGAIGTKFRVQWSTRADFNNVVGERELMDWRNFHGTMGTQYQINGLTQGRRYFIRASCGNVKGWGAYKNSVPASIIPSSWRDLNNREDRFLGRQHLLDNLFTAVRLARPADVSELTLESQGGNQKRMPKKKTTIKQLFSVASKFQKHLRRGIHLASIVYCDDKVLVTSEDFLPVIEIDESYPSSLYNDYHWLMKVACSWEDVKSLRSDMERNLTSANYFRIKLLSAVCQMQSALGIIDLGQLYYKPLKDSHGTIAIGCIHNVKNQKSVSILNSRWLPVNKLQKKVVGLLEEYTISEILISSLSDQIKYHQAALKTLGPGLYLGYLKMQCSMDQIQIVVPLKTPNVLPHYKVRDNNHINAEEWLILKRYSNSRDGPFVMDHCNYSPLGISLDLNADTDSNETTEAQRLFLYDLSNATQKLLHYMDVRAEEAGSHRLYDLEVIEHSKDISFLIICPAVQLSCAVPGQPEMLLQRDDLVPLSVQAFEMIHLLTYQPLIMQKYARLSCILELDTALANQSQREAFASSELQTAKERLAKLQELTNSLNSVWKTVRWLMDAIVFARDKNAPTSSSIKQILEFAQNCTETPERSSQFLQPPMRDVKFHKSGTGRGSWPGPATNATNETTSKHLRPEHSKSEQNLGLGPNPTLTTSSHIKSPAQNTQSTLTTGITSSFLHISNNCTPMDVVLRKSSVDSVSSSQYNQQQFYSAIDSSQEINSTTNKVFNIPLSRSDDTISEAVKRNSAMQRKCPTGSTPASSMKTVPGSKSVPHLGMDSSAKQDSSHSLTSEFGMEFNENKKLISSSNEKIKSASSVSLREGGVSLKTTLSSLPTEMRTVIPITIGERDPSTLRRNLDRESSNVEFTAISCPSLSSEQSVATASGIIQVYTAYNTGLASGTSLKLHVTAKTSAREIINLVVKQLNMATALKGSKGPVYSAEMMNNFCLVAVIGARERCLRDDFKPLLLQNPWRKGRLYVRQKHELLAAIDHSSRKSQLT